jgi:hypothetical protein
MWVVRGNRYQAVRGEDAQGAEHRGVGDGVEAGQVRERRQSFSGRVDACGDLVGHACGKLPGQRGRERFGFSDTDGLGGGAHDVVQVEVVQCELGSFRR